MLAFYLRFIVPKHVYNKRVFFFSIFIYFIFGLFLLSWTVVFVHRTGSIVICFMVTKLWYEMALNGYIFFDLVGWLAGVFNVHAIGYVLLLDFCTLWPLIKW